MCEAILDVPGLSCTPVGTTWNTRTTQVSPVNLQNCQGKSVLNWAERQSVGPCLQMPGCPKSRFISGVLGCTGRGRNSHSIPASLGWLPAYLALMGLGHPHRLGSWVQLQLFSALKLLCLHHLRWPLNPRGTLVSSQLPAAVRSLSSCSQSGSLIGSDHFATRPQ